MLSGGLSHKYVAITDIPLACNEIMESNENDMSDNDAAVALKPSMTLTGNLNDIHFLQSRIWNGLKQNLGETSINVATYGRDGLPTNYTNEFFERYT